MDLARILGLEQFVSHPLAGLPANPKAVARLSAPLAMVRSMTVLVDEVGLIECHRDLLTAVSVGRTTVLFATISAEA